MSGIGASLSTTLSGVVAESLGRTAGFLGIAALGIAAVLLLLLLMPETNPTDRNGLRVWSRRVLPREPNASVGVHNDTDRTRQ
jgi:predicted MFS family arabinose efflux permease